MTVSTLYRWSGFASILTGLILAASMIARFSGQALLAQATSFTAVLLLVFALTGQYAAQAARGGRLAFAGYLLAAAGSILTEVISFLWIATLAGISEAHAVVMFSWGTLPVLHVAVVGSFLGFLLYGIATVRAGVFPRWTGLVMAVSITAYTLAEYFTMLYVLALPAVLALCISLIAIGWTLIARTARQPVIAAAVAS